MRVRSRRGHGNDQRQRQHQGRGAANRHQLACRSGRCSQPPRACAAKNAAVTPRADRPFEAQGGGQAGQQAQPDQAAGRAARGEIQGQPQGEIHGQGEPDEPRPARISKLIQG